MTTDEGAVTRAKDAASTATDEGRHVGSVAADEARQVIGTAGAQARSVAGETFGQLRDQLVEQTSGQRDRLVGTLQSLGDDLDRMAEQGSEGGMASDLARGAASRARALKSHLDGREPGQLLEDVRDFARRRPGTFLLGALAAGVVAGRLFRGAADGAAAAELAPSSPTTPVPTTDRPGDPGPVGLGDDPLSGAPTVSSRQGPATSTPTGPPMPPSMPGQPTIGAP